jgi:hypothetical protein
LDRTMQDAAKPAAGQAGKRERDRVPERTEVGSGSGNDAGCPRDEPHQSQDDGMAHRRAGREPCCDVAAGHGVDDPIRQRQKQQLCVVHRFAPGRIDLKHMQHLIGAEREHDHRGKPEEDCRHAAPPPAGLLGDCLAIA